MSIRWVYDAHYSKWRGFTPWGEQYTVSAITRHAVEGVNRQRPTELVEAEKAKCDTQYAALIRAEYKALDTPSE